jgi:hypothetical protein
VPIKQVGEKGPIHTIPAPNLSLADKPLVVEEVKPQGIQNNLVHIQKSHQYQVTEPLPEIPSKGRNPGDFLDQSISSPIEVYSSFQTQNVRLPDSVPVFNGFNFPPQELKVQLVDNYGLATVPQPLIQQAQQHQPHQHQPSVSEYQTLLAQAQLFQPESSYIEQIQQTINQNQPSEYNLDIRNGVISPSNQIFAGDYEPVTDQQPKDVRTDESQDGAIPGAFYTTLPDRQTADALASLQAAGHVNIIKSQQAPLKIYVPDIQDASIESESFEDDQPKKAIEEKPRKSYGNRIRSKKPTA